MDLLLFQNMKPIGVIRGLGALSCYAPDHIELQEKDEPKVFHGVPLRDMEAKVNRIVIHLNSFYWGKQSNKRMRFGNIDDSVDPEKIDGFERMNFPLENV